ncbi:MAG: TldD/PmbA family protein [Holosporaceae bacterium]|jgi:PmbA protein|nr:TldD/PmbA family protein [Holosporaceae bacterium]
MEKNAPPSAIDVLQDAMKKAVTLGANAVDLLFVESKSIAVTSRMVRPENVVHAERTNIDLRVFVGKRSAAVSSNSLRELETGTILEMAIAAAENSPEEQSKSRALESELCRNFKKIDLYDPCEVSVDKLQADAQECESIALQVPGVTNSEGARAQHSVSRTILLKSCGFLGEYRRSVNAISLEMLAEKDGELQQDYDYSSTVYYADRKTPAEIAATAASRAVRKLGSRKIKSCRVPVIFHQRVGRSLLKSLLTALNGAQVVNGGSFLQSKLNQKIFGNGVSVFDHYDLARRLRSCPFDVDGVECQNTNLISSGVLNSFLFNVKYGDKMGMPSSGNAAGWDLIAPHNADFGNGEASFDDLVKNVGRGLFVTTVLGQGLNMVTGNYSQGASGFWIENGEIQHGVQEITIAGNFLDMFSNCVLGNDLEVESGFGSPTILVEKMTLGGL